MQVVSLGAVAAVAVVVVLGAIFIWKKMF